jgi:hypothetical protein
MKRPRAARFLTPGNNCHKPVPQRASKPIHVSLQTIPAPDQSGERAVHAAQNIAGGAWQIDAWHRCHDDIIMHWQGQTGAVCLADTDLGIRHYMGSMWGVQPIVCW